METNGGFPGRSVSIPFVKCSNRQSSVFEIVGVTLPAPISLFCPISIAWLVGLDTIKYGKTNVKDFDAYTPIAESTIIYRISSQDSIKLIHVEIIDEKLNKTWNDSSKRYFNDKLNIFSTDFEVRANDSILVRITRNINDVLIKQEYKYLFRAFIKDTMNVSF